MYLKNWKVFKAAKNFPRFRLHREAPCLSRQSKLSAETLWQMGTGHTYDKHTSKHTQIPFSSSSGNRSHGTRMDFPAKCATAPGGGGCTAAGLLFGWSAVTAPLPCHCLGRQGTVWARFHLGSPTPTWPGAGTP